jgi:hypothetical protein
MYRVPSTEFPNPAPCSVEFKIVDLSAYEEGRELVLEREQKRTTVRRHADILQGRGPRGVLSLPELTAILRNEKILGMPTS